MGSDCIFCKIAKKEIPADVVYEDDDFLAFKDLNPQAPVHVLFIPKEHVATLDELGEADAGKIGKLFLKIKDAARKEGIARDGYRVVANCNRNAGQEVFHVHFHLLGGRKFTWPPG